MTTAMLNDKALLAAPQQAAAPAASELVEVARLHGVSPLRQLREMLALRFGPTRIDMPEYHAYGLYDPAMPMAEKKQHVGATGNYLLNHRLSPLKLTVNRPFVRDKVLYTALLRQMGLPTTCTQAVVSGDRGFGDLPTLRDAAALRAFLTGPARFPLFGKPCDGIGSVGSVLLVGVDAARDAVLLGNGRDVPLTAFCNEVLAEYPDGFILQDALRQHPEIEAVTGRAVGTIRVVTIREHDAPRMLYAVWKIPAPKAMSDNFWQDGSMVARVDATGQVGACRTGTGTRGRWIDTHPESGARFDAVRIPFWDRIQHVTAAAHALFPEFGVVGWDVAVTPDGPVLIECNDNPYHALYQLAFGRGIHNPDFAPVFDRVAARSQEILRGKIALYQGREKAKRTRR